MATSLAQRWVSPPTRGWTVSIPAGRNRDTGFPAHAGMDPSPAARARSAIGFPRPRGDGPPPVRLPHATSEVSPPTRGWTASRMEFGGYTAGFPAHAGMDPARHRSRSAHSGFPRPRGDGPLPRGLDEARAEVSPPTRGWTTDSPPLSVSSSGFPAHAGMDPGSGRAHEVDHRFPRPRGDGPWYHPRDSRRSTVSPPTRGWTREC